MAESLPSISAAQSTARTGEKSTHCRLAPLSFICYGKGPGIACSFVFGDCLATRFLKNKLDLCSEAKGNCTV